MCVFSPIISRSPNSKPNSAQPNLEEMRKLLDALGVPPVKFNFGRAMGHAGATIGIGAGAGAAAGAAGTAAGFTTSGIAAGSAAAAWQSAIGSVAAGSTFASLQSLGALGGFALGGIVSVVVGSVAAITVGSTCVGIGISKHLDEIKAHEKTYLILIHV